MFELLDAVHNLSDSGGAAAVRAELSLNESHLLLQISHLFPAQRTRPGGISGGRGEGGGVVSRKMNRMIHRVHDLVAYLMGGEGGE